MKKTKGTQSVLIIGGCGYIGSRLFQFLSKKNLKVDTVDLEWFGNYVNPQNIKLNYKKLDKTFLDSYDSIILLAGHSNYYMCESDRLGCFKNNVENFIHLLSKLTHQKLIYASSSSIHENSNKINIKEDYHHYKPLSIYDLTKHTIDQYAALSSVKHYGLRFGTVNGWSPNFRTDLAIHRMYDTAMKTCTIVLYNPKLIRPFLGIHDLCRAMYSIITEEKPSGIYNLASFHINIREMAKGVANSIGNVKIVEEKRLSHYKSFTMSTEKFEKTYDFAFKDTLDALIQSVKKKYKNSVKTERK